MEFLIFIRQFIDGLDDGFLGWSLAFFLGFFLHLLLHFFGCHLGDELLDERVRGVDDEVVLVRHLAVEGHPLLMRRHLFHSAHELVLGQEDRQGVGCRRFAGDEVTQLVLGRRQHTFKRLAESLFLLVGVVVFRRLFFLDQILNRVAIHTYETQFLVLLLRLAHGVYIEFAVHEQHVIAFRFRTLDIGIVSVRILGIKDHHVTILIYLILTHFILVFLECEVVAV